MIFRRAARLVVAAVVAATSLVVTGAPATAVVPSCVSAGLTVTALHGPNFYIDTSSSPALRGAYAGYRVTDTSGNARTDLWVALGAFTGGSVALGAGQPDAQQVATLGAGSSASRFFYLTAQAESSAAQGHSVAVWQGRPDLPGSARLCADGGGFSAVVGTIKAAANKLTSVVVSAGTPRIGGTFTVTVTGDTGTIGAGSGNDPSSFWMSPAASGSWPAGAYRLVGTSLTFTGGATYTDTLRVSGLGSASKEYTAVYTFRAVGFTSSPTSVLPVQQIASGTQIKHTDVGGLASLPAIAPSSNDLTLAMTASAAELPHTGGTVTYQLAVSGSAGAVLDSFTATVAAGVTLVPGSVTWNGAPAPDGVGSGGTILLQGPFTVTGSGDVLTFTLALPATSGDRLTSAVATVGSATIDTTVSLTDEAPATRTVNVNTFPVAAADSVTVSDNRTSTVTVTGNDTDADGDTLTVVSAGTAAHGTTAVNAGVVSYTPAEGYTGPDTFTYTVSDGRGGTDTAVVTVEVVTPSGPPPQTTADPAAATAGDATPIDVLANDTGEQLTVTAVGTPGHGTAAVTSGGTGVTYTADLAFTGTDTFTYTATDLGGRTAVGTVTVTVTAPAPVVQPATLVAAADQAGTAAGTSVTVSPLDNDTGDGPLSVQSVGLAGHGSVSVTGDAITYVPEADFWGTDTFPYTVTDAHAATATGTVTVTVAVGPGPADDSAGVGHDTAAGLNVLANDPPAAVLAEVVTAPAHGTAVVDGDRIRYTPAVGYRGSDSFTYRLIGAPGTATVQVTVAVPVVVPTPVLPAGPVATDDTVTTARGTAVHVEVLANDTGTGLTVSQVGGAAHGSTELRTDGVWYTPAAGFRGSDSFVYTALDQYARTAVGVVQVTVPNAGPTITAVGARTVTAGQALEVPFTVTDPDDDPLTLTAGTPAGAPDAAARIRRGVTGSRLTLTVDVRFSGNVTVPVTVSDGEGSATTDLAVTVLPAAARSATGRVIANPKARALLADPAYVNGRPVSRTLSGFVDSLVTWRVSPTTALIGYRVTRNGERICTVRAVAGATTQSCRVRAVVDTGDALRVTAVGIDGTLSTSIGASITPASATNRLLAVVYFPTGEFALDATARQVLATVARQARAYGFGTALMVGHTDADGTAAANATLSRRRAEQVAGYFHRTYPALRADHTGRGETEPVRPNTGSRNKAANRRVEIYVG